jgi:CRISPR-associated protein Cmr4
MTTKILHIFTRTPLHVGAGFSVGAVDQPVIRERHTDFPVIPGSSLKGVISDLWPREQAKDKDGNPKVDKEGKPVVARSPEALALFGAEDANAAKAGTLLIGEAKLLAFPIRSAKGCFAWLTCPLALNRFFRDTGKPAPALPAVKTEEALTADGTALAFPGNKVIFEEYPLATVGNIPPAVTDALKSAVADAVWQELPAHLAIISDELFSYFAANACEIAQHIRIDDEKGTVAKGALFNQENVPSETLFYAPVHAKADGPLNQLAAKLSENANLLQFGADETTGLGWCSINLA